MTKNENATKIETSNQERPEKEQKHGGRQRGQKKEKVKPPTKIIIRHLPPTMTEEDFLKQIDPLPDHDFYYFAAADWSLGFDATCRAYITFKNYDDVFLFRDRFDGYVFVDSKGAEYPAIVEFAPFQGLLKNKSRRSDNKVCSIEQEQHYQQFLIKLEEDREAAAKGGESKLEFSLDRKKEEKITSTPLLQYLANKKEKRREEAKKRTEEKRRQREEEKKNRPQSQQQVTKIMSGSDAGKKDGKSAGGKDGASNKGEIAVTEDRKNSRSKRRAERDQRRREEYEQRKREQKEKEKGASAATGKVDEMHSKAEAHVAEQKADESGQQRQDDGKLRKEGKRYSERRERERNRNRKDKEKDKEKEKITDATSNSEMQQSIAGETSKAMTVAKTEEISDSVRNFIRSVATAKEFVPKYKQAEQESKAKLESESVTATKDDELKEVNKQLQNIAIQEKEERKHEKEQNLIESIATDEYLLQRQRSTEERRIRNKDRPSIAIYTPKPRQRLSEESDSNAGKDVRSNPTSDCESLKKEDTQRIKKVSRYSERRSERRAKDKDKQKSTEAENSVKNVRRISKSCDDEDSIKTFIEQKSEAD